MFNEKRAVKVMLRPSRIIVQFDQLNKEVIIRISAIKFGNGGRAILAKVIISHQNDIRGNKACRPRFMKIERVWVRSYVILARQNKPDETNPCAIIIARAPDHAHGVIVKIPATTRPMWLTDE